MRTLKHKAELFFKEFSRIMKCGSKEPERGQKVFSVSSKLALGVGKEDSRENISHRTWGCQGLEK